MPNNVPLIIGALVVFVILVIVGYYAFSASSTPASPVYQPSAAGSEQLPAQQLPAQQSPAEQSPPASVQGLNDNKPGWFTGRPFSEIPGTYTSPAACQQAVIANKTKPWYAWGWRNTLHPEEKYRNTCFGYTAPGTAPYTLVAPNVHVSGCLTSNQSMANGCN